MELDNRITGKTGLIGLIGNPVEHSVSPQLHNTISRLLGKNLVYIPMKVERDRLENAVKGLAAINMVGFNVTIPYKQDVMKYLDEVSKEAAIIGAVNTVKIIDGKLHGYNTDCEGFLRSFREETGAGFRGARVLIIGAGGASRAIAVSVAMDGAEGVCIVNRTPSKAIELVNLLNSNFGDIAYAVGFEKITGQGMLGNFDVIINTTSLGMYPETEASPLDRSVKLKGNQIVYDIIYNPLKTKLLEHAESFGCKAVNGLGMLLYQGISAYELWTGEKVLEAAARKIYRLIEKII